MALTQIPIELSSTPGIVDNSNATAITIDSSENVLVGKSVTTFATEGATFEKGGALELTTDSGRALRVHRTTNDGSLIEFNKDSTTVGSIATVAGRLGIGTGDAGLFFDDDNNRIGPVTLASGTPVDSDGLLDLGYSGARYKDLYLSGGVVFGDAGGSTTSTSNSLDSYEEGTWTPVGQNINGSGYNVEVAQYTKVGRLVSCDLRVQWTGSANTTGSIAFSLPFQSQNTTGASRTGLVFYQGTQVFGNAAISTHIANNSSNVSFYKTNGGSFQAVSSNQVNGSYNWLVSFSYFTA